METERLDDRSVTSPDGRVNGAAHGVKARTTERRAIDGKPLRSERGIREVERNIFRVRCKHRSP